MKPVKNLAKPHLLYCVVLCFVLCGAASAQDKRVDAPASPADEQSIGSLLKEVRLMRMALERATNVNLNSYQAQISVERLRIQQEHVDRLARQLEAIRNEIAQLKLEQKQMADRTKELEETIRTETEAEQIKQAKIEIRQMVSPIENLREKEQTRAEQERQLSGQLQTEQAKLDEMNNLLERLLRRLEAPNSTEAPVRDVRRP